MQDFELEVEQENEIFEIEEDNTPYVNFGDIGGQVEENQTLVDYIEENGGKIDKVKVNGVEQPIVNKEVDLSIPTKTSDLTNDSNYQNANQVNTIVEGKGYQTAQQVEDRIVGKGYDTISNVNSKIASAKSEVEAEIPTKVSELTNDSGYQNASQVDSAITSKDYATNTKVDNETQNLQQQIDAIVSKSDIVDIVGTYQDLLDYDTSSLLNNDVIKVLQDETHDNASSYYRWVIVDEVGSWNYVGSEGLSYTKAETDTLLNQKVDNTTFNETINTINTNKANVSYVNEQVSSLQTSISQKESLSNKTNVIDSGSTNAQYPSAKATFDGLQDVREVAEGKTKTYVVSTEQNPSFDTQNDTIEISSFTDVNGNTYPSNVLKVGDNVYVKELDKPDRWCEQASVPRLPSEYQEVEWIGANGTQFITTNYTPQIYDDIVVKNISSVVSSNNQAILSAGNGSYQFILMNGSGTTYYKYFASENAKTISTDRFLNKVSLHINSDGEAYINNVLLATSSPSGNVDTTLWLFKRANNTSFAEGTLGEIIFSNNGNIGADFIPCYRKADNEIGMYDLVSDTFYSNDGTGEFTKGNDLTPNCLLSKLETSKVDLTQYYTKTQADEKISQAIGNAIEEAY